MCIMQYNKAKVVSVMDVLESSLYKLLPVSLQIIHRVRKVGRKDPDVSPDEICERIFKVVDVDGDGE